MKKKIVIIMLLLFSLCGCTKRFTIENKEDNSQKTYVSNILCKPETKELQKIYSENSNKLVVKYENLPQCKNLKINSGGYEGLWTSLFVKPLAWVIVKIGLLVKNNGLAIMIVGFILRAALLPLSLKSANMNENMQKAQKDLQRLEKKYQGKEDRDALMMKSQEMMLIYKKYNINPMSSCLFSFLQLPIFFAFLEAINRVPAIFEENLFSLQLGTTPLVGIKSGNYLYLVLIILIIATTYLSFKFSMTVTGSSEQQQQMQFMTTFMLIFISIASFSLPTAIALYWVVTNGFSVIQTLIVKKRR